MSNRFDLLTQQLFQKNISDCSVEELQSLADQYPYFAPAQYVLLKKLQQTENANYAAQLQKSILYYHNPPLFEQFINEEAYEIEFTESATIEAPEITTVNEEPVSEPENTTTYEAAPGSENLTPTESFIETEAETTSEEVAETEETSKEDLAPLNLSLPPITEAKDTDTALAFEPYHTVDYFASQGIKLSQEEATKDRFGRQLKSFTEWLKTMKKLPANEQVKPIDAASEQKVENLAAHSVEQAEIVTETMAEVWAKQGNHEKAIEIYNKLSLLNPSKRAYFAAKVDFLKKEI